MEKRKEIQIENLQEQPIQSTLGLCYPIPPDLVLFSPLRFYLVVPKKKKKKVLFGPILFTSVLFSLIHSTLVEFSPLRSYSIPQSTQVLFGPLWSYSLYFHPILFTSVHSVLFGPIRSTSNHSIYFCAFRKIQVWVVSTYSKSKFIILQLRICNLKFSIRFNYMVMG